MCFSGDVKIWNDICENDELASHVAYAGAVVWWRSRVSQDQFFEMRILFDSIKLSELYIFTFFNGQFFIVFQLIPQFLL